MKIRVGVEGGRRAILKKASELRAPILVSANSLWDNKRKRFSGWKSYAGHDVALDSGGFVAMKRYGGYRWNIQDYVLLAKAMNPSWWAQMDFCCEPEIAQDHCAVRERISRTARHLAECQRIADGENASQPMPVLQGWKPEDYCNGPIFETDYQWPDLVGIGSVCRRQVGGSDGIMAVIEALNTAVPSHVRFHLFGVKSTAIEKLVTNFPQRICSMDSMAWNLHARWETYKAGISRSSARDADIMGGWFQRQTERVSKSKSQLVLDFGKAA